MGVGFVHGEMNTDNMTISGETIDYGPCAFMDRFALGTVFSSIDTQGRYAYGNQPRIAQWNLTRLAEALLPLIDADETAAIASAEAAIEAFGPALNEALLSLMRRKLGLANAEEGDLALAQALMQWMQQAGADHTRTFRDLTEGTAADGHDEAFRNWHDAWMARRARRPARGRHPPDARGKPRRHPAQSQGGRGAGRRSRGRHATLPRAARGRAPSLFGDTVKRALPQPAGQPRRLLPHLLRNLNPSFTVLVHAFEVAACHFAGDGVESHEFLDKSAVVEQRTTGAPSCDGDLPRRRRPVRAWRCR
jgi:uncharacterized protein YdiU (UPF0061 family)